MARLHLIIRGRTTATALDALPLEAKIGSALPRRDVNDTPHDGIGVRLRA